MTDSPRYSLVISARNVRGIIGLPVQTLNSAKTLALEWKRTLTAEWSLAIVDNQGAVQWTL